MTATIKAKTHNLQIRVSPDQLELLRKAHVYYIQENNQPITFGGFCREQLLMQTLVLLKMVELP